MNLVDGEDVYVINSDELLAKQLFSDELTIRIMNTINMIESSPETKLILNDGKIIVGTLFEYNDNTYYIFTDDKKLVNSAFSQLSQRDIIMVRVPRIKVMEIIDTGFMVQIPYMTRMMFINETEESYLTPIIVVVENKRIKDFITDKTFNDYEHLFIITEITPSEYGKIRFVYVSNNISIIRTSHYKYLSVIQKETINNIIEPLYERLEKLYTNMGNTLKDIKFIHDDFVYSVKKVNDVVIKQPYLFLYLFAPDYFMNIRNIIMTKIRSIDQTIILDALKKYSLNFEQMKSQDPETILLKFILSDQELINFARMVDVRSDWLIIFKDFSQEATDEIRYQNKIYYTSYKRNKKFSEIYDSNVLYAYPLTLDERTIQFTDIELILKLYANI